LLITAAASIAVALLAAHLFLRAQLHRSLLAPDVAYYAVLTAGLATSMAIIGATLPLLNRVTGPESARND